MSEPVRILIVEDVPSDFDLAQREIRKAVHECVFQHVQTQQDFLYALDTFQPDLILSDYQMPGFDGLTALKLAQEHAKLTPFIIWTGTMGEDVAVECMKAGAVNYILKENIKRLGSAVAHALEERRLLLEHQRAAEAIENSEKRFRALIENGQDNISLLAADGTLVWESPATVRMLGYAPDEFLGQNIFQLIHPDDRTWTSERFASVVQELGSREQGIFRLRHRDGTWRWTEAVVSNLLSEPSVKAIVINYRDISARKQAEEMLQEERNLLRTLIDHLPDRIYVMDAEGRKTLSNTADWKASGGKTMEEVIGKTDFDTYPPEMAEEFWALDKAVLNSGKPVINYEEPGFDASGDPVWVLSTKVPLRDGQGKVVGLVGIGRDITERKQAEIERQTLLEIMQGLANTDDLQHFLRLIHRSIARMIYAENFFVVLYNEATGLFEEIYSVDQYDEPAPPSALEKSITSYVFRTGEPLLLTQSQFDALVAQGEVELVGTDSPSWLGAPLKTQSRSIGVIVVQDYENLNRYTERDRDFLALIGSQVALAIERKRAEEALRQRELEFRSLTENIPDVVARFDRRLRHIYINDVIEKITGIPAQSFIGRNNHDMEMPEAQVVIWDAGLRHVFESGQATTIEFEFPSRAGLRYFESLLVPELGQTGEVERVLSIARDITERKQSADRQKYHARLLRHINDAVIATDHQFHITAWNRAAEKMYGWSSKEVMGRNVSEVLNSNLSDEQRIENRELLKQSNVSREERIYQRSDGRTIYVEANTIALSDEQGKFTGYVSVNRDITERRKAEEQTQLQIQRLRALRAIDVAISFSFNLSLILDILLDQVIAQLNVDAAAVLLFQPTTKILVYGASRGFRTTAIREAKLRLDEAFAGKAILEHRMIHIPNLMETDSQLAQALLLKREEFIDYYGLPLIVKGEMKGILEIFQRSALESDPEWLDFLETLAGQAVIAIENTTLFENLQRSNQELFQAYDVTIEGWSHALDLRDKETEGHTQRVTELTVQLARKFGFTEEQLIQIRWGALLHDIGKMGVPDNILLKPDKLTEDEWESMKKHPTFAFEMLSPIVYLRSSLDIPYCHHEKWDGSGYPRGLKGEVIPLAARLFAVVDVWDALCSDRPYRKSWSVEKTIEHIRSQAGTHFDPKVVEYFVEMLGR